MASPRYPVPPDTNTIRSASIRASGNHFRPDYPLQVSDRQQGKELHLGHSFPEHILFPAEYLLQAFRSSGRQPAVNEQLLHGQVFPAEHYLIGLYDYTEMPLDKVYDL